MRILLVSEGKHEASGALEGLVRRLLADDVDIDQDKVSRREVHSFHGKGDGYLKKALGWMIEAKKRDYGALILVIDEDHQADRVSQLDAAQKDQRVGIRRALGVAIHTFDAWMLADETALTRVLGAQIDRQRAPESIPKPKEICADLLNRSDCHQSQAGLYKAVAEQANLQILEERCPKGFKPFADRVRTM